MCTEVAPWMYNLPESVTFTPLSSAWPSPSAASSLFRANIPCSLVPPHILQAHGVNARMKLLCQRRAACPKGCWRKHVMGDELRHSRPPEIKINQVCWIGVLVYPASCPFIAACVVGELVCVGALRRKQSQQIAIRVNIVKGAAVHGCRVYAVSSAASCRSLGS